MLFSSSVFLFFFLPAVLAGYYILKCFCSFRFCRPAQNVFLLLASLLFYAWGEPVFVLVMLLSIAANWFFGMLVGAAGERKRAAKAAVAAAVVFDLGVLFIFKYLMFTLENVNSIFGASLTIPVIELPIGVSFFTFQAMSYVIDVYRGDGERQKNPLYVGLYISLFAQLIAGPIVRYRTVADEIKNRRESFGDFSEGIRRFIVGFLKKVLIANTMAIIADAAFDSAQPVSVSFAWLGAAAYALQIYYDFSGYSDMGIGMGRMFGFHFLENFNYPYISTSISEFWRRWHISLGTWFRDYVYFPLGGSRVDTKRRLIFNLFVVWFLTGVWHGAEWTFVLWGLMYFILISAEKLAGIEKRGARLKPLRYIYTMLLVLFGWVLFRAENLSAAAAYFGSMFGVGGAGLLSGKTIFYLSNNLVFLLAGAVFSFPVAPYVSKKLEGAGRGVRAAADAAYTVGLLLLFAVSVSYIIKGSYNPFIYFNF